MRRKRKTKLGMSRIKTQNCEEYHEIRSNEKR